MRPHPRVRKTIKWGGAVVTVLLVVAWIGSAYWEGGYNGSPFQRIVISRGQFGAIYSRADDSAGAGWGIEPVTDLEDRRFYWLWAYESGPDFTLLRVPIWLLVLPCVCCAVLAWRLDILARHRARLNLCPKCNYARAGLADGAVCPECGAGPKIV